MAPSRRRKAKSAAASQNWNVGELVLAKVKGYPAWPAIVSNPEEWGYPAGLKKVLVFFFGTREIALCNPVDLQEFTEEKKLSLSGKRYGKSSDFVRALNEIIESFDKLKKQDQVSGNELYGETDLTVKNYSAESFTKNRNDEAVQNSDGQRFTGETNGMEFVTEAVETASETVVDGVMQLDEARGNMMSAERHVCPTSSPRKSRNCSSDSRMCSRSLGELSMRETLCSDEGSTGDLGCKDQTVLGEILEFRISGRAIKKKRKATQQRDLHDNKLRADLVISEDEVAKPDHVTLKESAALNECIQHDGDEHLPLAKRARIRMGSHAWDGDGAACCEEEKQVEGTESPKVVSDGALNCMLADGKPGEKDLRITSPAEHVVETLVDKLEEEPEFTVDRSSPPLNCNVDAQTSDTKLDLGHSSIPNISPVRLPQPSASVNCCIDGESALPLSKRINRALEAMSANVAEAGEGDLSVSPAMDAHGGVHLSSWPAELSEMPVVDEGAVKLGLGPVEDDKIGDSQSRANELCVGLDMESFEHHGQTNCVVDFSIPEISEVSSENVENEDNKCGLSVALIKHPVEDIEDEHLKSKSLEAGVKFDQTTCVVDFSIPGISEVSSENVENEENKRGLSVPLVKRPIEDIEDQHLKPKSLEAGEKLDQPTCVVDFSIPNPEMSEVFSENVENEDNNCGLSVPLVKRPVEDIEAQHLKPKSLEAGEKLDQTTCVVDFSIPNPEMSKVFSENAENEDNNCGLSVPLVKRPVEDIEDQHLKPKSLEAGEKFDQTTCVDFSIPNPEMSEVSSENVENEDNNCGLSVPLVMRPVEDIEDQHLKPKSLEAGEKLDQLGRITTCSIAADNNLKIGHRQESDEGSDPNVTNSDSVLVEENTDDPIDAGNCNLNNILDGGHEDTNQINEPALSEKDLDSPRAEFVEDKYGPASPDSVDVPSEIAMKSSLRDNSKYSYASNSVSDNNLANGRDSTACISPPNSLLSSSKVESLSLFEGLVGSLTRSNKTITRVTEIAIECAKFGHASKVVEILVHSLESESSLPKKVDLFFLVDSITRSSRSLKGDGGMYPSLIQPLLPRLLLAAAPPGLSYYENQRQCLKVLRAWLERKILPESTIRHHIEELDAFCNLYHSSGSRRTLRNERAFDDPVREMEGILVDEYGSNSSIQFSEFCMLPMRIDADGGSDSDDDGFEAVTPERDIGHHDGGETSPTKVGKQSHILEDVDGELEMEDVAPCELKTASTSNIPGADHNHMSFHVSENHYGVKVASRQFEDAPPLPPGPPPSQHILHQFPRMDPIHMTMILNLRLAMRIIGENIENQGGSHLICLELIREPWTRFTTTPTRIKILISNRDVPTHFMTNLPFPYVIEPPTKYIRWMALFINAHIRPILTLICLTTFHTPKNKEARHGGISHQITTQVGSEHTIRETGTSIEILTETDMGRKVVTKIIGVRSLHPLPVSATKMDQGTITRLIHRRVTPTISLHNPVIDGEVLPGSQTACNLILAFHQMEVLYLLETEVLITGNPGDFLRVSFKVVAIFGLLLLSMPMAHISVLCT